jgi:ADP-heptose:LPS heptosyltransferase
VSWRRDLFETLVRAVRALAPNREFAPVPPQKIFVLRNNDIGDLLVITPLFEALKRKFPQAEILAGIGSWNREVLTDNPYISKILEVNAPWHNKFIRPQGIMDALRYVYLSDEGRSVRGEEADIGIDVLGSGLGSLLLMRARIPYRLGVRGYAGGHSGVQAQVEHCGEEHVGRQALRFAELLGCTDLPENRPQIFLGRMPAPHKSVVLAPGVGLPGKGWPADHFVRLSKLLGNVQFVVIGSEKDRSLGSQICENSPLTRDLTGKLSLRESFEIIGGAKLVICNSSMAMHAAAAFRRPTVVVLGEQFPSALQHLRQWGYPETTVLGRDERHPSIFSPHEVALVMRDILSRL